MWAVLEEIRIVSSFFWNYLLKQKHFFSRTSLVPVLEPEIYVGRPSWCRTSSLWWVCPSCWGRGLVWSPGPTPAEALPATKLPISNNKKQSVYNTAHIKSIFMHIKVKVQTRTISIWCGCYKEIKTLKSEVDVKIEDPLQNKTDPQHWKKSIHLMKPAIFKSQNWQNDKGKTFKNRKI